MAIMILRAVSNSSNHPLYWCTFIFYPFSDKNVVLLAETDTEIETSEIEDDWIMQEMKIDTETEAAITIIEIGTSHLGKDLDLKTISGPMGMPMISLGSYIFY